MSFKPHSSSICSGVFYAGRVRGSKVTEEGRTGFSFENVRVRESESGSFIALFFTVQVNRNIIRISFPVSSHPFNQI